jgi:hypothetical protein
MKNRLYFKPPRMKRLPVAGTEFKCVEAIADRKRSKKFEEIDRCDA